VSHTTVIFSGERVVFYYECFPGKAIRVSVEGEFDSDLYSAAADFLKRQATRPVKDAEDTAEAPYQNFEHFPEAPQADTQKEPVP
jgi:hypothetical protein